MTKNNKWEIFFFCLIGARTNLLPKLLRFSPQKLRNSFCFLTTIAFSDTRRGNKSTKTREISIDVSIISDAVFITYCKLLMWFLHSISETVNTSGGKFTTSYILERSLDFWTEISKLAVAIYSHWTLLTNGY